MCSAYACSVLILMDGELDETGLLFSNTVVPKERLIVLSSFIGRSSLYESVRYLTVTDTAKFLACGFRNRMRFRSLRFWQFHVIERVLKRSRHVPRYIWRFSYFSIPSWRESTLHSSWAQALEPPLNSTMEVLNIDLVRAFGLFFSFWETSLLYKLHFLKQFRRKTLQNKQQKQFLVH